MKRKRAGSVSLLLAAAMCCYFHMPVFATTATNLSSHYMPDDKIQLRYEVDADDGVLCILFSGTKNEIDVQLSNCELRYRYKLLPGEEARIPLNMGNGAYHVEALLYITPNAGEKIWSGDIQVAMEDDLAPFLATSKIVNWSKDMSLAEKARSLTAGLDAEKSAIAICSYIAEHYSYRDADIQPGYIPDLEKIGDQDTGICYDFAALFVAMCRSVSIPCKLVMGYSQYMGADRYHAWGQVYVNGQWCTVDPTYSMQHGACFLDSSVVECVKVY